MIHDPGVLTRGNVHDRRNQETLTRSVSLRDLTHHCFKENPLRRRARIEQDETFVAFENQIPVTERSHETESCPPGHRCVQLVIGSQGLFRKGNDRLRRLGNEGRFARDAGGVAMTSARLHERPARRVKDGPLQHLGPAETHLPLGRMDIAIDQVEIHLDVKHTGRMLTALENAQVGFAKRLLDRQAMNRTPVENHELEKTVPTSLAGAREKPAKPDSLSGKIIDLEEPGQISTAKQVPDANRQAFGSWKRGNGRAVTPALEGYGGIRQRDSLEAHG